MNGVDWNIIAYAFFILITIKNIKSNKNFTILLYMNILILSWFIYFFIYLISDYEGLVGHPIKDSLNTKEIITHFILALYIGVANKLKT